MSAAEHAELTVKLTQNATKCMQATTMRAICHVSNGHVDGKLTSNLEELWDWKRRNDRMSLAHSD